jgi:RIO kinase 2
MRLDVRNIRFMDKDDFRVLVAIEMGMRNHEFVPTSLIASVSAMNQGRLYRILSQLHRFRLIVRETRQ